VGGGDAGGNSSSPTISSVTVGCAPPAIPKLAVTTCSAAVSGTGSYDSSVTWSTDSGSIDSSGRFTAPDSAGTAAITATSVQDSSRLGQVLVTIAESRATVDRPDDVAGYQVHVMYIVPSDGIDNAYDLDGKIGLSVERWNTWLVQETGGRQIRLDTANGELDVTFVRLDRTHSQMNAYGGGLRKQIEYEIVAKGFDHVEKIYLVYYDGGSLETPACGMGAFPPVLQGTVSAMFLTAWPNGFDCSSVFFAASIDEPGRKDHIGIHEVLHSLGFVPSCSPNQGNGAHITDDVFDQMYVGFDKSFPPRLDANRDDYFEHSDPTCLDLADSAFLDPLPASADAPPGWPYSPLPALLCADEALMQSGTGNETAIQFINATNATVNVYWLDFSGIRQPIDSILPNEGFVEGTFLTHPFVVTDETNQCLAIYLGASNFGRAVVR